MYDFSNRLITWQNIHGRHDLPWQTKSNQAPDPYAIWVSEIMLQQTQVAAVIGYYSKFMQRFPNISSLANATQDEVLQHWSGLGYYSRARNLHNAAVTIMHDYNGQFPQNFDAIQALSGIGRSTAAAIASFAFNQVQTILDGNVKRVLARHFLVEGWPSSPKVEKKLWGLAEKLLPEHGMVAYTQGLMDLGATICTRSKPKCSQCPISNSCEAYLQNRVHNLPTPKPRKTIPEKQTIMLILMHDDKFLLEKRPPAGIWGSLWSFPETDTTLDLASLAHRLFNVVAEVLEPLPKFSHAFTHYKLHIQPQPLQVIKLLPHINENRYVWLNINDALDAAIPTPIRKILQSMLMKSPA
ncbi:MAG: A/G-specific adenine glycosylase [Methylotenera sp.]|nr:A/G-specific adenine glycosylase [Methylotenera sp.]